MNQRIEDLTDDMLTTLALTIRGWRKVRSGGDYETWYDENNVARNNHVGAYPLTNPFDFSNFKFWAQEKYGMVISSRTEVGMVLARAYIRTPKFLIGQCSVKYKTFSHIGMDRAERKAVVIAIVKAISQETIDTFKGKMIPLKLV
jgi:hypothetical protein